VCEGVDYSQLVQDEVLRLVVVNFSVSIIGIDFLDQLKKEDSAPWSLLVLLEFISYVVAGI
jgi:hypothetical protein